MHWQLFSLDNPFDPTVWGVLIAWHWQLRLTKLNSHDPTYPLDFAEPRVQFFSTN